MEIEDLDRELAEAKRHLAWLCEEAIQEYTEELKREKNPYFREMYLKGIEEFRKLSPACRRDVGAGNARAHITAAL